MAGKINDPLSEFAKCIKDQILQEIVKNIERNDVDLLANFQMAYKEITLMTNEIQKTFGAFEKKMKKIIDSPSLYEDVYKMRDELIEIKRILKDKSK